jgi:hypothetical protein
MALLGLDGALSMKAQENPGEMSGLDGLPRKKDSHAGKVNRLSDRALSCLEGSRAFVEKREPVFKEK